MKIKASYTVEAAIIMPIVMLTVALIINVGIIKYNETQETIAECMEEEPPDAVGRVRLLLFSEDVLEELKWN